MRVYLSAIAIATLAACALAQAEESSPGVASQRDRDLKGSIDSSDSSDSQSLAGTWRFQIAAADAGLFSASLPDTTQIRLPGTMDDAGLGPKNEKKPTLAGPARLFNYAGPAWYQRDIEIPDGWAGKRITLYLERCRWVTTAWLDDQKLGSQDSLIAPHIYDLGANLKPGKHRLTLCVDNRVKLDLGGFVSALFGGTFGNMNGVVGRIELNATPPVWIEDVQVYPNLAKQSALVKVQIGNATGKSGRGSLSVGTKTIEAEWGVNGGQAEIEVPVAAKPWDEFSPNLTELTVKLGDHSRSVRFGMREFKANGTQFALNGRPVFLRGTLECSIFPLTGYPPTDVESWRRICQTVKSYGLNYLRFHSWCPPEAAFTAADLEGIFVQVEGPMANVPAGKSPERDAFIVEEFKRIQNTYGNHPSFCTMALGNEFGGNAEVLEQWVQTLKERDPRRLYTGSCGSGYSNVKKREWSEWHKGRGIRGPDTQHDLSKVVAEDPRPIIGHEIGAWLYWPDFNEIKKWTGVMALKNFEMIRDDLMKKNLLELQPEFFEACGKFSTLLYKEEIELLLRTQGYGGFSLLDLHDYPTQGTAIIGPLNAFWESKGFITPEAWRKFCGPTVPLVRMAKRTFVADEPFEATVDVAHYGPADISHVRPAWSIKDSHGSEIASGTFPEQEIPTGKLTSLGSIAAPLAKAEAPGKLTVTVTLGEFSNDWEIWVYPAQVQPEPPAGVVVCDKFDTAKAALAEGKKVVLFAVGASSAQSMRGKFLPVYWSPVWFSTQKPNTMGLLVDPKHPLFAQFPTDMHSNWQWYELMQRSRLFVLDGTPATYRPMVQVIDNFVRNSKLGIIFEGRVGNGQLLVCGFDLLKQSKDPVARQLLAAIYSYVGSPAFHPSQEFSAEYLDTLLNRKISGKLLELGATVRASSENHDHPAAHVMDGEPNTMWHTPWNASAPQYPHELVFEWPKPAKIGGIVCMVRQDESRNGMIKGYAVYVSANGKDWNQPVAQGEFGYEDNVRTIKFAKPVETRFLRFVALNSFEPSKPGAALSEFDVLTE
jgi:hypothetical protein